MVRDKVILAMANRVAYNIGILLMGVISNE